MNHAQCVNKNQNNKNGDMNNSIDANDQYCNNNANSTSKKKKSLKFN